MLLRTDTKTLVMAALVDGPRHGYALTKSMHKCLDGHVRLGSGQIYVALRGLEAEGFVIAECADEGSDRRVYRLTQEGRRELDWRAAEWRLSASAVSRLLPSTAGASSLL